MLMAKPSLKVACLGDIASVYIQVRLLQHCLCQQNSSADVRSPGSLFFLRCRHSFTHSFAHPCLCYYSLSDKRGPTGGRIIAGSVQLKLSASPSPGSSRLGTYLRLACSFLVTPHPVSLHTSGVLESLGRDQRAAAAGQVVSEWLLNQGQAAVPDSLVRQVRSEACCTSEASCSAVQRGYFLHIRSGLCLWQELPEVYQQA